MSRKTTKAIKTKSTSELDIKKELDSAMECLNEKIVDAIISDFISISDIEELINKHFGKFCVKNKESYIQLLELERLIEKLQEIGDKECTEIGLTNAKPVYMKEFQKCSCCSGLINITELAIEAKVDRDFKKRFNSIKTELSRRDSEDAYEHRKEIESIAYMFSKEQSKYTKIWICKKCVEKLIEDASKSKSNKK